MSQKSSSTAFAKKKTNPTHCPSTPDYGLQSYWEERYKNCLLDEIRNTDDNTCVNKPRPGFSWYFTYSELRPLLYPLLEKDPKVNSRTTNGGGEEEVQAIASILEIGCGDVPLGPDLARDLEGEDNEEHGDNSAAPGASSFGDGWKLVCIDYSTTVIDFLKEKYKTLRKQQLSEQGSDDRSCGDDATTDDEMHGNHFAKKLKRAQSHGSKERGLTEIRAPSNSKAKVHLEFLVADATKLHYGDEEFLLAIDKGTLDAVLFDKENGYGNCRSIVKEMARVVIFGGSIMIVSHLNANDSSGEKWLNEILIPGLENACCAAAWDIEIHGKDTEEVEEGDDDSDVGGHEKSSNEHASQDENKEGMSADHDNPLRKQEQETSSRGSDRNEHENDMDRSAGNLGPAVYIIRKNRVPRVGESSLNEGTQEDDSLTVNLNFFAY